MKTKQLLPAMFLFLILAVSCTKKTDTVNDKEEVTSIIKTFFKSFESQDMELMSSVMAHDEEMVNFGTDLSEHEVGWQFWKDSHLAQFKAIDKAELYSKDLTVFLSQTGNVAWFADISDWFLVIQNDSLHVDNVRVTGVLEKRDSLWKIVQIHASVPQ